MPVQLSSAQLSSASVMCPMPKNLKKRETEREREITISEVNGRNSMHCHSELASRLVEKKNGTFKEIKILRDDDDDRNSNELKTAGH